ncbi:hypothetical protein GCM10007301_37250 [Azorhizobium oxalatiphilum]|uniref:Uncharacterized protein n=1 Tax=Azorhizobium oxalatiphilum TaxID=980631 RepID=A0A917FGK7_9HYPH|nr:hypothetical protein [Azorhizobium oxalatiphilum]GGF73993.1 hypothetical protein GCM10007301_37250 [Azorhizobium oxalatiphilum]
MLCAECPRCHRRSILGKPSADITDQTAPEPPAGAKLRCDFCGSKNVKLIRFDSPMEALRFANTRGTTQN